ncbi:MAG: anthranilate synthase component II [Hyphomonadaceae bacterium]|nr:MAG: anthranilate synthase component II [Hyphomonadaceae bacterium]KAF0186380.1 MAG: anthranilate synthase component II [Hyphomonadaceae bacterium]
MTIKLLLIDNYDSFTYNLVHYFEEMGANVTTIRNDVKTTSEILAMGFDAICLSPGPKNPDQAGICLELLKKAPQDLPIFGVCLGHQSIGQAMGGKIIGARAITHGKTSMISNSGGGLFVGLPSSFEIARYHSLAIEPETLPDCLQIDATTADGEIMGISHKTRPIFGVQFHPESIASQYGHEIIGNFLQIAAKGQIA